MAAGLVNAQVQSTVQTVVVEPVVAAQGGYLYARDRAASGVGFARERVLSAADRPARTLVWAGCFSRALVRTATSAQT